MMKKLEEVTNEIDNRDIDNPREANRSFVRDKYIGDVIFAVGTGIGITGGLTGSYNLIVVGSGVAFGGAMFRVITGYTQRVYNRTI